MIRIKVYKNENSKLHDLDSKHVLNETYTTLYLPKGFPKRRGRFCSCPNFTVFLFQGVR